MHVVTMCLLTPLSLIDSSMLGEGLLNMQIESEIVSTDTVDFVVVVDKKLWLG